MTITQEQLLARRSFIGSSDTPKILGADPMGNAADVYWSKTGGGEVSVTPEMTAGNFLEPSIIAWAEHTTGHAYARAATLTDDSGIFGANFDGLDVERNVVLEAKAVFYGHPSERDQWGKEFTDEIPVRVMLQVTHQLYVARARLAHVVALLPQRGFVLYYVERNDRLVEAIVREGTRFWAGHVMRRIPPLETPSLEILRSIERVPGSIVPIQRSLFSSAVFWRDIASAAEAKAQRAKAELIQSLGVNERGMCDEGEVVMQKVSVREHTVKAHTQVRTRLIPRKGNDEAESSGRNREGSQRAGQERPDPGVPRLPEAGPRDRHDPAVQATG